MDSCGPPTKDPLLPDPLSPSSPWHSSQDLINPKPRAVEQDVITTMLTFTVHGADDASPKCRIVTFSLRHKYANSLARKHIGFCSSGFVVAQPFAVLTRSAAVYCMYYFTSPVSSIVVPHSILWRTMLKHQNPKPYTNPKPCADPKSSDVGYVI